MLSHYVPKRTALRASILCLLMACIPGCVSRPSEGARPIPTAVPTATVEPPAAFELPKATFRSTQTGSVVLDFIGGNGHPCSATRLYIGLAKPADAKRFLPFIGSQRTITSAVIDDPTGGHNVYTLRDIAVTGKQVRADDGPRLTLRFAAMSMTWCDHRS